MGYARSQMRATFSASFISGVDTSTVNSIGYLKTSPAVGL
jgi:hypothetical protein